MRKNRLFWLVVVLLTMNLLLVGCFSKEEKESLNLDQPSLMLTSTNVVISEVYYDTTGDDTKEEFIELYNMGTISITVGGWTLTDNYSTYTIPAGISIPANSAITIARDTAGFNALFGSNPTVSGLTLALGNTGDKITLKSGSTEIDFVAYENYVSGWSCSANTSNSIERNPADIDTGTVFDWISNVTPTPGTVTTSMGVILMSEVYYDTPGTDSLEEYIELYNTGGIAIDVSGWTITDNYSTYTIPANTIVAGRSTVILAANAAGFNAIFGFNPNISGMNLALSNSGDKLTLKDNTGVEMDFVAYENYVAGWSISASTGKSIERNPANNDTDTAADWIGNATATPGTVSTGTVTPPVPGKVVFSEIYYDTTGTDAIEEFVELYNTGSTIIDISGWTITDNAGTYTIPANTTIGAQATLVIAADTAGFNALFGFNPDISGLTISLSNTGDKLTLKDAAAVEKDFVAYENYVTGWSISAATSSSIERNPASTDTDTAADWVSNVTVNPGTVNGGTVIPPTPAKVLFSEVYYDTIGTDSIEEFIELYNTGSSSVDVSGWTITDDLGTYTIPANTTIGAYSTIVIAADSTGFNALFGINPNVSGLSLALNNTGDQLILKNAAAVEIDFVAWENYVTGWSISALTGKAIQRSPIGTDTDTASDWVSEATPNPNGHISIPGGSNPAPGVLKVHYIDVGQGDSILIQAPTGEAMLIDAGSYQIEYETKVLSYLSNLGLANLTYVVATHPHSDHIGSLDAVVNNYPVGRALDSGYSYTSISYTDYMNALNAKNVPIDNVRRGQTYSLSSNVQFEILSPTDTIVNAPANTNDVSVVLRLTYGSTSFILTGDAPQFVEMEIVNGGYTVDSNGLKVGHHGSYTSTAPAFVDAVTPTAGAVIMCGEGNPYGHPHAETLDTLNSKNVTILRTDLDGGLNGDILMVSDGTTVTVQ